MNPHRTITCIERCMIDHLTSMITYTISYTLVSLIGGEPNVRLAYSFIKFSILSLESNDNTPPLVPTTI